jgi:hypothetical protein
VRVFIVSGSFSHISLSVPIVTMDRYPLDSTLLPLGAILLFFYMVSMEKTKEIPLNSRRNPFSKSRHKFFCPY